MKRERGIGKGKGVEREKVEGTREKGKDKREKGKWI